ncbi:glutamate--tRNA ligase [Tropicimonas sp. IMCC34011]|uniref:glutamate--tRNA ligase n=1 Tax=Tropicimonas sp. IMCC34011 TaxID=2248759 RepID=UPI000E254C2B|nr:glutamate--tRNA ligase [Tropicimonas sp. IMCC34011]
MTDETRATGGTGQTEVVTRFAPSPTGALHIGGARTALFNWLFARGHGGTFLLRIEDTDRARSTPEAERAIFDGLTWLGLDWDGDAVSQAAQAERHREVAEAMLEGGTAYKCFSTPEEVQQAREDARAEGRSTNFVSPWRDVPESEHPGDRPFVVRIKAPREGQTVIEDAVQGSVTWASRDLDDMVLLRSDGTPTYMLAVVVDDHDMGVTHVIRGDDHLANAARQKLIYDAMGWTVPVFAHIPLILGPDGKKLSKRHGATGAAEYRAMGYPAAAMRNYLARLGWSHGDDEFFTDEQAKEWFDLAGITKSAARLDFKKLEHISGLHIASAPDAALVEEADGYLAATGAPPLSDDQRAAFLAAMPHLKERAKTFGDLLEKAHFALGTRPFTPDEKAAKALDADARALLGDLTPHLRKATWERTALETACGDFAAERGLKFGKIAGPIRAALSGRTVTPSVFDMMLVIGRDETIDRLKDAAKG